MKVTLEKASDEMCQAGIEETAPAKVLDAYVLRTILRYSHESKYKEGFTAGMFISALLSLVIFLIYLFIMYHLGAL